MHTEQQQHAQQTLCCCGNVHGMLWRSHAAHCCEHDDHAQVTLLLPSKLLACFNTEQAVQQFCPDAAGVHLIGQPAMSPEGSSR